MDSSFGRPRPIYHLSQLKSRAEVSSAIRYIRHRRERFWTAGGGLMILTEQNKYTQHKYYNLVFLSRYANRQTTDVYRQTTCQN
jgi:hypothetical protein